MSRFSLRQRPPISYFEPEEPSFDEYVYCDECADYVFEYCAIHGPLLVIPDDKVPAKHKFPSYVPRAALTIPHVFLHLNHSTIPGAGLGVFTTLAMPRGVRFGPYRGVRSQGAGSDYCWQIYDRNNKPLHLIDAVDADKSNWMRYVNCSRYWQEQNLLAYQYQGELYYRTVKTIPPFTELLIFYGSEFANYLGIDLKKYNSPTAYALQFGAPAPKKLRLETQKEKLQEETAEEINSDIVTESTTYTFKNSNASTPSPSIVKKNTKEISKNKRTQFKTPYKSNKNKPNIDTKTTDNVKNNNNSMHSDNVNTHTSKSKTSNTGGNKNKKKQTIKCKPMNKGEVNKPKPPQTSERNDNNDNFKNCNNSNGKIQNNSKSTHHTETQKRNTSATDVYMYCNSCEFQTVTKDTLKKHMRLHNTNRLHVCEHCGFRFETNSILKVHLQKHSSDKKHDCGICSYQTNRISHLKRHLRVHAGQKPFSCTLCEYKCSEKNTLTTHLRTHTGEKPFSCNLCEFKSSHKYSLTEHLRTHTGEKPFSCNLCEFKCSHKNSLTKHLRTHTGEKPFSCTLCEYKCSVKSSLTRHSRTHTGEKPFSCTLCEYKCSQKSKLTRHLRTHTGEKPFSCTLCEYKCSQKIHLTTHLRTHTGEKPFSCTLCEYKCSQKSKLTRHLRTHTGEKP